MKSVKEIEEQICWAYSSFSYPAARAVIIEELTNWKKDVEENQAKNDAEVCRLVLEEESRV